MDFNKILANKPLLYGIIGGLVIVMAIFLTLGIVASSNKSAGGAKPVQEKVIKEDLDLLTTDNLGKAIEIQALLAREGINAKRKIDGTKSTIYLSSYTQTQRDRALLAIVKSGLMDQNVGLEIFDKGDFTSTKEDKRIRLSRAINGELSRLIRKIPPIENASVFISIPEQSMFSNMQKAITATVQITIPSGTKLDQIKVKAITNLLLGSVSGLTAENISITDTNGNVYSSIMNAEDEMLERIEENDKYMQQKVNAQLDRLIGKGNYVATVSTFLRQAPAEKYSITYNPNEKAAITEQVFTEGLGDRSQGSSSAPSGPVSVYLPNNIPQGAMGGEGSSSQNRNYARTASERQYGVSKTQVNEYMKPGLVEEISIAVTLEKNAVPADTTVEELKELIARAASPKVKVDNVTIAFSDSTEPYLATDRPVNLPKPDETGNPWWITIVLVIGGLIGGFAFVHNKMKKTQQEQAKEMEMLRNKTADQDRQLQDVNMKASELIERQTQLAQGLLEQQQREYIPAPPPYAMTDAINALRSDLEAIDENEAGDKIKSWIEQR
ncbi:hypothetical protein IJ818_07785 [bacterium]|nr:hypothetical protein [bacterium]